MKFIVEVAVVEPSGGFRYVPLRECAEYEDAELARRAYLRKNPALSLIIEQSLKEGAAPTNFEKIAASPEALAAFLSSLPLLAGPWDEAFHRRYCDACPAEECGECENKALNNPLWWLSLAVEETKKADPPSRTTRAEILEYARECGIKSAANLLLLMGPDGFDGDYNEYLELERYLNEGSTTEAGI